MKYIILFILIMSCKTKVSREVVPYTPSKSPVQISPLSTWNNYSKDIDIMVAFLWPEEVKIEQRNLLNEIIKTSRDLKNQKESFLKTSYALKKDFDQNYCNCVLNYECTGEEDIIDENICYDIEEKTYANDRLLIDIYALVELIKSNVKLIGGHWLETHLDYRNLPNSQVNFSKMELNFSAFDSNDKGPYTYPQLQASLTQKEDFKKLDLIFKRQHESIDDYGNWIIEAVAITSEYSLLFQGKLFWEYEGKKHEGMIYWEHPKVVLQKSPF